MKTYLITFLILLFGLSQKLFAVSPIDHLKTTSENSQSSQIPVDSKSQVVKNEGSVSVTVDPLMGFQAWKEKQVLKARSNLNSFKTPKTELNPEENPLSIQNVENSAEKAEIEKIQNNQAEQLRQLEFNLEIALGLTIHDYFSLYLKDKNKEEMAQVIPKLTPDELSALLVAYKKTLYGLPIVEKDSNKTLN